MEKDHHSSIAEGVKSRKSTFRINKNYHLILFYFILFYFILLYYYHRLSSFNLPI